MDFPKSWWVMGGAGAVSGEAFAWAIENPDKVSRIYGENPILRSNMAKIPQIDNLAPLAEAGIPLLHVCGGLDPHLNDNTRLVEKLYRERGGWITVLVNEGEGRFLSPMREPKPAVDFIVENAD